MVAVPSPLARGVAWQLDDLTVQRLAVEVAREMYSLPEILGRFNLDAEIFRDRIHNNPTFLTYYKAAYDAWHGATGTPERIQLKSQALFEDWLAEADRLMHDSTQPLSGKVELLKIAGRIGRLDGADKNGPAIAPGDRVLVQINLGAAGQPQPIVIDKVAPPATNIPTLPSQV